MSQQEKYDTQRLEERKEKHEVHEEDFHDENSHIKFVQGSRALALAKAKEPPHPRSKRMMKLYMICAVAFMCSRFAYCCDC